ncbi:MAG: DUF1801 domain-containing protein [Caulobacteraceae bacterium]|nr:DUF1801 domain-containing protein [Caulobacteraceae bacterium]
MLFRLSGAVASSAEVEAWFDQGADGLRALAKTWFDRMRACGGDVRELVHDGRPTACLGDVAFGYVGAFRAHVGVGFYNGAALADPARLLEGTGKRMRHVKIRLEHPLDEAALQALIVAAYADAHRRLGEES